MGNFETMIVFGNSYDWVDSEWGDHWIRKEFSYLRLQFLDAHSLEYFLFREVFKKLFWI